MFSAAMYMCNLAGRGGQYFVLRACLLLKFTRSGALVLCPRVGTHQCAVCHVQVQVLRCPSTTLELVLPSN